MSRNESHQLPLYFAVRMNEPAMVALLMELGADPLAVDGSGFSAAAYAPSPHVDRPVMQAIAWFMTAAELTSAELAGDRRPRVGAPRCDRRPGSGRVGHRDAAGRREARLGSREHAQRRRPASDGQAQRCRGRADGCSTVAPIPPRAGATGIPRSRPCTWLFWEVIPRSRVFLLRGGADPRVRDSKHDSDAMGWAVFLQRQDIVQILEALPQRLTRQVEVLDAHVRRKDPRAVQRHAGQPVEVHFAQPWQARQETQLRVGDMQALVEFDLLQRRHAAEQFKASVGDLRQAGGAGPEPQAGDVLGGGIGGVPTGHARQAFQLLADSPMCANPASPTSMGVSSRSAGNCGNADSAWSSTPLQLTPRFRSAGNRDNARKPRLPRCGPLPPPERFEGLRVA